MRLAVLIVEPGRRSEAGDTLALSSSHSGLVPVIIWERGGDGMEGEAGCYEFFDNPPNYIILLRTIERLSSEALYHFTNLWFNRTVFPFIRPISFSPRQSYQRTV